MSLYRQAGGNARRAIAAAALLGVVLGGLIGYLAGRGSADEPSAAEVVADARAGLRPVSTGLEVLPIEYEGSLEEGRVAARTEYEAARAAAARADAALAAASEDMRAIDPAGYAAARRSMARLGEAIEEVAPAARVDALSRAAQARIDALAGG
jgi:hypothetical protein